MRKAKEEKPLPLLHNGKPNQLIDAGQVADLFGISRKTVLGNWRSLKLPAPIALGNGPKAAKRWWLSEILQYAIDRMNRRDIQGKIERQIEREHRRRRG